MNFSTPKLLHSGDYNPEQWLDRLYQHGISTILATPSGATPRWLAEKCDPVAYFQRIWRRMPLSALPTGFSQMAENQIQNH